jgi:hypothetical protein
MLSHTLRITRAPYGPHLQMRDPDLVPDPAAADADNHGWITVRPVQHTAAGWFYVLGTPDAPTWHALEPAAAYIYENEFDDDPVPIDEPPPAFFDLSPDAQYMLTRYAQGVARDALSDLLPPEVDAIALSGEITRAGFAVRAPMNVAPVVKSAIDAVLARHRRHGNGDDDVGLRRPPRIVLRPHKAVVAEDSPIPEGAVASVPVKLSPDALARLQAEQIPRADRPQRYRWPFSRMDVGEVVTIPHELSARAQRAAHAHASHTGKRFVTRRNAATGLHHVYRIK